MELIRPEQRWFRNHIVKQPIHNINYRPSNFIVNRVIDDGILLFNNVSGCLILFESENDIESNLEFLIEHWFYLPVKSFNEYDWVDFLRKKRIEDISHQGINSYVIMTTLDCNARCFYCYEKGASRISMTEKIAIATSEYIRCHSSDTVKITWFGGEPLLNTKIIDLICQKLQDYGVSYFSCIITNGLLITKDLIDKVAGAWNLKRVQITLDGTENIYLKTKSFVNSKGNEFRTVLDNIESLLNSTVSVSIRLNQDRYNTDDLLKLLTLLHNRFGVNEHLTIYNHLLFNFEDNYTQDQIDDYYKLKNKLGALGYLNSYKPPKGMNIHQCMADSPHSIVITPTGRIGKCEHYTDEKMIGSIFVEGLDASTLNMWEERYEMQEKCNSCPLYPSCIRIKMCPNQRKHCSDFYQKDRLEFLNIAIEQSYIEWKTKR